MKLDHEMPKIKDNKTILLADVAQLVTTLSFKTLLLFILDVHMYGTHTFTVHVPDSVLSVHMYMYSIYNLLIIHCMFTLALGSKWYS